MAGFGPDCLLRLFLEHNGVSGVTRGRRPRFVLTTTNNSSCPGYTHPARDGGEVSRHYHHDLFLLVTRNYCIKPKKISLSIIFTSRGMLIFTQPAVAPGMT